MYLSRIDSDIFCLLLNIHFIVFKNLCVLQNEIIIYYYLVEGLHTETREKSFSLSRKENV